ncbi:(deoxy)nucleoside triphosphate pyrophosphohydrolase [Saccharicrinis sp. FJH54]|uniref:(deoxy)nucleoside triphosphate pyrophosphohydrolase n=1 Tax=Saccharicrinis sp. FJH54 TaxID=3344665 RepID=UPI0035D43CA6
MLKVTCAIIIKDQKILICKRSSKMHNGSKWEFPGGKVKDGEDLETCIVREIREELNIRVTPKQQLPSFTSGSTIELVPFICPGYDGQIALREHAAFTFCALVDLNNYDLTAPDKLLYNYMMKNPELLG